MDRPRAPPGLKIDLKIAENDQRTILMSQKRQSAPAPERSNEIVVGAVGADPKNVLHVVKRF
jgi:hypothetical protein